jgi:hypothetical protein
VPRDAAARAEKGNDGPRLPPHLPRK